VRLLFLVAQLEKVVPDSSLTRASSLAAHCIALLTVGGICIVAFGLWERFGARHPLIPFRLLTNRTVIICALIAVLYPAAGGVIGSYLCVQLSSFRDEPR